MKRCSSAPCLEDVGGDAKRTKGITQYTFQVLVQICEDSSENNSLEANNPSIASQNQTFAVDVNPNTKEYLQLALARVLELQRKINEGTYAEIDNDNDLDVSGSEEDLMKEIFAKVFQDLPGTPSSIAKIIDGETHWRNPLTDAIHSKRIQLLGFDTCRRMALEFMKTIVRESRNRSPSLEAKADDLAFQQNESLYSRDEILANDLRKRESNAETRARMLRSLDLHLAAKQRDYTAKLMNSGI